MLNGTEQWTYKKRHTWEDQSEDLLEGPLLHPGTAQARKKDKQKLTPRNASSLKEFPQTQKTLNLSLPEKEHLLSVHMALAK